MPRTTTWRGEKLGAFTFFSGALAAEVVAFGARGGALPDRVLRVEGPLA